MSALLERLSEASGRRVENLDLREARREFERVYFIGLLIQHGGRIMRVWKAAGMGDRGCVYRKLQQLGISAEDINEIRQTGQFDGHMQPLEDGE